jgi:hypothetical protein
MLENPVLTQIDLLGCVSRAEGNGRNGPGIETGPVEMKYIKSNATTWHCRLSPGLDSPGKFLSSIQGSFSKIIEAETPSPCKAGCAR